MKEFKIVTDTVFEMDGIKYQFDVNGIDIQERFLENPSLLFQHIREKVIGYWEFIRKEANAIFAIPNFDNDTFSQEIADKVKRGSLKSASSGILLKEGMLQENGVILITKSELFEASIVSIPAIKDAMAVNLHFALDSVLTLSDGNKINSMETYLNKIKKMEKEITNEVIIEPVEIVEDTKFETLLSEKVELNLKLNEKTNEFNILAKSNEELLLSLNEKVKEVEDLKNQISNLNDEKKEDLLDSYVEKGVISKDEKSDYRELSMDKIKSILDKFATKEVSIYASLRKDRIANTDSEMTIEDYIAKGKSAELKRTNPALYEKLINKNK